MTKTTASQPTTSQHSLPLPAGARAGEVLCANPRGLHQMRYLEWGDVDNPRVLVCVHGLTRNGRDFARLASALAADYRIVSPDVAGRGESDWLPDPLAYSFPQYVADMLVLLARLNVPTVDWLGTSMGGLIGMFIASCTNSPIRRLLLNDVGPVITRQSLQRIAAYVGKAPDFASLAAAEAYIRLVGAPFGALSDADWQELTASSVREEGGRWRLTYDPAIGQSFGEVETLEADVDLWPIYDAVRCPTLLLRGAESDLLTAATAAEMRQRGPKAKLIELPAIGHAPMFLSQDQIDLARNFFTAA